MPRIRASALWVWFLWLAVPAGSQEPAEPPPEASPSPRVLLPLKSRPRSTLVLPRSRVREYQVSSSAAWEALQGLVRDLGLGVANRDKQGQVLVTSWQSVSRQKGNGLEPQSLKGGAPADEFQLHLFVSPFTEPARVYADAVARSRPSLVSRTLWTQYAVEPVALWLFGRLGERLGEEGRPVPFISPSWSERPGGPDANQPCPSSRVAPETKASMQEPRSLSRPQPLFPSKDLARRGVSKVGVAAVLGADGAIQHVSVPDVPPDDSMAVAAANAVALWRYEPARLGGCPVPAMMNVTVSFRR